MKCTELKKKENMWGPTFGHMLYKKCTLLPLCRTNIDIPVGLALRYNTQLRNNVSLSGMNRFYWNCGRMYDQIKLYVSIILKYLGLNLRQLRHRDHWV